MPSSRRSTGPRSEPISGRSSARERPTPAAPDPALVERFAADLEALIAPGSSLGLAVSGGPDSLALLLLAAAARPGRVEAATVDHRLRPESADEAAMVAAVCGERGIPHSTLPVDWEEKPRTALQERARSERYRLLGGWAEERALAAVATGHHLDDQAETLVMRLNRGAGVRGLGAMRALSTVPGRTLPLLRPLLGWRRSDLLQIVERAGLTPVDDRSNRDGPFERVRIRRALGGADWLDVEAVARSAANLASADDALDWAAEREWNQQVERHGTAIAYCPTAPTEIRRRVVARAVGALAAEGAANPLRGRELDRLVETLSADGTATLRGVRCAGIGDQWQFAPAPRRKSG